MITTYKIELKEENMECVRLLRSIKESEMAYSVFLLLLFICILLVKRKTIKLNYCETVENALLLY